MADALGTFAREGAADGFDLVPHLTPGGLDELVDRVVPLLRERGAFPTEYAGATLRSHPRVERTRMDGLTERRPRKDDIQVVYGRAQDARSGRVPKAAHGLFPGSELE